MKNSQAMILISFMLHITSVHGKFQNSIISTHKYDEIVNILSSHYVNPKSETEWNKLKQKYKRLKIDEDDMVRGLLSELDPNMDILSKAETNDFHSEVYGTKDRSVTTTPRSECFVDNFLQFRIHSFSSTTKSELLSSFELSSRDARGVVLDLRGNPGGQVNGAVAVAEIFLPPNTTVAFLYSG
jgi:hypothetical protein